MQAVQTCGRVFASTTLTELIALMHARRSSEIERLVAEAYSRGWGRGAGPANAADRAGGDGVEVTAENVTECNSNGGRQPNSNGGRQPSVDGGAPVTGAGGSGLGGA